MPILSHLPSGLLFGLAAGVSPGPLLALVIAETVKHNTRQGILVASAPLVTDAPIVAIAVLLLSRLSQSDVVLGSLSLLGAGYIAYLAYESITTKAKESGIGESEPHSFRKGIVTNFLSPHPYLFWATIGTPMIVRASRVHIAAAVLYVAGFYVGLVGSKVTVALVVERSKRFLSGRIYVWIVRVLGIALAVFALLFVKEGLDLLGVIGNG